MEIPERDFEVPLFDAEHLEAFCGGSALGTVRRHVEHAGPVREIDIPGWTGKEVASEATCCEVSLCNARRRQTDRQLQRPRTSRHPDCGSMIMDANHRRLTEPRA